MLLARLDHIRLVVAVEIRLGVLDGIGVDFGQVFHYPLEINGRRSDILDLDVLDLHITNLLMEMQLLLVDGNFRVVHKHCVLIA